jgi:hypothetical protein
MPRLFLLPLFEDGYDRVEVLLDRFQGWQSGYPFSFAEGSSPR